MGCFDCDPVLGCTMNCGPLLDCFDCGPKDPDSGENIDIRPKPPDSAREDRPGCASRYQLVPMGTRKRPPLSGA